VRALAGTTFRAPSFNDLYYPGYGVATVQPERGRSIEAGLQWHQADSQASATVYRNLVSQLIGYQADRSQCPAAPAFDFGCAGNTGSARLLGATFNGQTRVGAWTLRATLDLLDATDEATGERLARRARHQETLAADWRGGPWSLGGTVVGVGDRPDGGKTLGAYATLDLQARWQLAPKWQLEARLLNVFDRDVEPVRDYRGLGRQAWIGVRYERAGL
jgi:vitamin B12 transporter